MPPGEDFAPLESVLRTEELARRPSRPPDYEAENRAMTALVRALADAPSTILQTLADTMLEVFRCGSAGLSLLAKDGKTFYWPAIAGLWGPHAGGGTPRDHGPCGDILDRNVPLLFTRFERRYPYLLDAPPAAEECLLVPFQVGGKTVGTVWAIVHDDRRVFDGEDLRLMESLARFAAAAYRAVESALEARRSQDAIQSLSGNLLSEARFRALFAHGPLAIYSCHAAGVIQEYNASAAAIWGREPRRGDPEERFCGSHKLYLPDGSPLPHDQTPVVAVLRGEVPFVRDAEAVMERPDGTRLTVVANIVPLNNDRGAITGAMNCFYDITDRKRAEEALRESQSRLRHAANAAGLTYVEVDLASGVARTAENFAAVMGYAPPEQGADVSTGSRLLLDRVVPDDRAGVRAALREFTEGRRVGTIGYRVLGDDRVERFIESVWSIECDPNGVPLKSFATNLDVTDRKRAEAALRHSEQNLRFIMDSAPQKICTARPDGGIDYCNPQWLEYTGLTFAELADWGGPTLSTPTTAPKT